MITSLDVLADPELLAEAQSLFRTIILGVLALLGSLLAVGIPLVSKKISTWLEAKGKGAKASAALKALQCFNEKLRTLATSAVAEVEQTLVRQLKADGTWNAETAMKARDTAVEVMTRHAGENGLAALKECGGMALPALMGVFRTWVEMIVGETGAKGKNAPIVPMNDGD